MESNGQREISWAKAWPIKANSVSLQVLAMRDWPTCLHGLQTERSKARSVVGFLVIRFVFFV